MSLFLPELLKSFLEGVCHTLVISFDTSMNEYRFVTNQRYFLKDFGKVARPTIVSQEDFMVNELARKDRGEVDEQDVKSVSVRQEGKLD
jgi:hypothetical protein